MAKPSAFMRQLEAQNRKVMDMQRNFTIQQMEDFALIARADEYEEEHDGEPMPCEDAKAFRDQLKCTMIDYCSMALDDDAKHGNNDPTLQYTKGKMDERLQKILGPYFEEWETRYGRAIGEKV